MLPDAQLAALPFSNVIRKASHNEGKSTNDTGTAVTTMNDCSLPTLRLRLILMVKPGMLFNCFMRSQKINILIMMG